MSSSIQWLSAVPKGCDLCGKPFGEFFIDGKTTAGPWALMCEKCHQNHGYGLGIGLGQKYRTRDRVGVDGFEEDK